MTTKRLVASLLIWVIVAVQAEGVVLFLAPIGMSFEGKVIVTGRPVEPIDAPQECIDDGFITSQVLQGKSLVIVQSGMPAVLATIYEDTDVLRAGDKLINFTFLGNCGGYSVWIAYVDNIRGVGQRLLLTPVSSMLLDNDEGVVTGKLNDDGSYNVLILSKIKGEKPFSVPVYADGELKPGDRLTGFYELGCNGAESIYGVSVEE